MSELVCPWCGVVSPMGSAACTACGASLQPEGAAAPEEPAPQTSPEPEIPKEPAAGPPPPESVVQAPVHPQTVPASPSVASPPAPVTLQATSAPVPPAASGGTASIANLVPCPHPGCFGVVAPGDDFCTFCGGRLSAAPAPAKAPPAKSPPLDQPPPEPFPPPPLAESGSRGGALHLPRAVWVVLSIIPLGLCAFIAAVVLSAMGVPSWALDRHAVPEAQREAERMAWPNGTPTPAPSPTATRTATPTASATPTVTRTSTAAAGATARAGTPTMTPDPKWTPLARTLAKSDATVPVTADSLFSGVTLFSYTGDFAYEIMGRGENCRGMTNGRGVLYRRLNGVPTWEEEKSFTSWVSNTNGMYRIRADDPGLKAKQWVSYPCP
jgi:hypothetical protein